MRRMRIVLSVALTGLLLSALLAAAPEDNPFDEGGAPKSGPHAKPAIAASKSLAAESGKSVSEGIAKSHENCLCAGDAEGTAIDKIERVLKGPLSANGIDFTETPFRDVVNQLQEEYGIPIQIDAPALDENGIPSDTPVTVNIHNTSLQSALRLMLMNLRLTWSYQNEVLMITTHEGAEKHPSVCIYNVHDIVNDDPNELHWLVDTITTCVATKTWAKNGGTQPEIRTVKPDLLVISQTQQVHENLRDLLATIRKMRVQATMPSGTTLQSSSRGEHEQ
jgi:hypothetical protein